MNNRTYLIGIAILAVVIIGAAVYLSLSPKTTIAPTAPQTSTSGTPASPTPSTPSASVYENASMKVELADGWKAVQAGSNPDAVNITKDNWILYINVNASQASGVEGGRFAEIAQGAPSVDAVVTEEPNECGKTVTTAADNNFSRVDYFMSAADKTEWCAAPTNGKTVWFFSYLTTPGNGFFNDYTSGSNPALVVTMAYNSKVINSFPVSGSTELKTALKQMTDMADTIFIKQHSNATFAQ
jgi:hypothetical protein